MSGSSDEFRRDLYARKLIAVHPTPTTGESAEPGALIAVGRAGDRGQR